MKETIIKTDEERGGMTITQMETFLKIAETRNFTIAANLLG